MTSFHATAPGFAALLGALLWLPAAAADPKDEPTDFIRYLPGKPGEGKLETAIATYTRDDGARVELVAAVHIGDAAYYRKLEDRFAGYESLLYEMIKPSNVEVRRGDKSGGMLSFLQRGLKDVLHLEFQLDAMDYGKKNFVHADLDPETFFRLQAERGESILGLLLDLMLADMKRQAQGDAKERVTLLELVAAFSSRDGPRKLKLLFARELEDMEKTLAGIGRDGEGSVLLEERNKAALKVLGKVLAEGKKKVGIFYGGAHMTDMEKRLLGELGFRRTKVEWVTAWDIARDGGSAAPVPGADGPQGGGEPGAKESEPRSGKGPRDGGKDPEREKGDGGGDRPREARVGSSASAE